MSKGKVFLFLLALAAGICMLTVEEILGLESRGWVVMIRFWGPALVVVLYFALYALIFGWTKRNQVLGDSMYYLGFLFTLFALAYTFMGYGDLLGSGVDAGSTENGGGSGDPILAIISKSGFALVSTITGLLLRILVTLFWESNDDARAQLKKESDRGLSTSDTRLDASATDSDPSAYKNESSASNESTGASNPLSREIQDGVSTGPVKPSSTNHEPFEPDPVTREKESTDEESEGNQATEETEPGLDITETSESNDSLQPTGSHRFATDSDSAEENDESATGGDPTGTDLEGKDDALSTPDMSRGEDDNAEEPDIEEQKGDPFPSETIPRPKERSKLLDKIFQALRKLF